MGLVHPPSLTVGMTFFDMNLCADPGVFSHRADHVHEHTVEKKCKQLGRVFLYSLNYCMLTWSAFWSSPFKLARETRGRFRMAARAQSVPLRRDILAITWDKQKLTNNSEQQSCLFRFQLWPLETEEWILRMSDCLNLLIELVNDLCVVINFYFN